MIFDVFHIFSKAFYHVCKDFIRMPKQWTIQRARARARARAFLNLKKENFTLLNIEIIKPKIHCVFPAFLKIPENLHSWDTACRKFFLFFRFVIFLKGNKRKRKKKRLAVSHERNFQEFRPRSVRALGPGRRIFTRSKFF